MFNKYRYNSDNYYKNLWGKYIVRGCKNYQSKHADSLYYNQRHNVVGSNTYGSEFCRI